MAYGSIPLIGYQLLDMPACEGDRPVSSDRPAHCQREAQAMPPRHSSHPAPRAAGLPPKGGTPTPEGRAHAHRSDFRQGVYAPAETPVLGQDAPDLRHLPGVGVRVSGCPAVLPAGSGSGSGSSDAWFVYRWNRQGRKGQRCQILARGTMNSRLLRFEDGFTMVSSGNALAKEKRTPSALRAPGDISGAGAPALVRAPALPRGKRAAR